MFAPRRRAARDKFAVVASKSLQNAQMQLARRSQVFTVLVPVFIAPLVLVLVLALVLALALAVSLRRIAFGQRIMHTNDAMKQRYLLQVVVAVDRCKGMVLALTESHGDALPSGRHQWLEPRQALTRDVLKHSEQLEQLLHGRVFADALEQEQRVRSAQNVLHAHCRQSKSEQCGTACAILIVLIVVTALATRVLAARARR
mmetsp:Transcript_4554/g.12359  ORF Transcript_4554/g.12359 Transcript_4554/m.12359 type:complete len:201 (-) Transcript_4554:440-1042(-)